MLKKPQKQQEGDEKKQSQGKKEVEKKLTK